MLHGNAEGQNEVNSSTEDISLINAIGAVSLQFAKQILLAQIAITLLGVNPEDTRQIAGRKHQLSPILPALVVAFVCG
jgi:hypothetical protein